MAEFHKSGLFEPFLRNCAATAARINRKAVYSVDINYGEGITVQPWIAYKNEITEVKVSQGVESIGIRAFEGHKNLKKVELPEGLECIFAYAFKDCINLKTIRIPSSICILDSDAFENCPIVF